MARLKNIFNRTSKASSLTEVLVATTILLVVFAIALGTLHMILKSTLQKDTQRMHAKLEKLSYQYKHKQLKIPNTYTEDGFVISIQKINQNGIAFVAFSITNTVNKKSIIKKQLFYEGA